MPYAIAAANSYSVSVSSLSPISRIHAQSVVMDLDVIGKGGIWEMSRNPSRIIQFSLGLSKGSLTGCSLSSPAEWLPFHMLK